MLSFLTYSHLSYICFIVLIVNMGKEVGRSYSYNWSKLSSATLKNTMLSSLANHTSYTGNLTCTIISSQLENENITAIQNTMNIWNTDDIHSCVTPRKQNISAQATYIPTWLTSSITTLTIAPVELPKTTELPWLVKNICISRLTSNLLMLINVSNQGY